MSLTWPGWGDLVDGNDLVACGEDGNGGPPVRQDFTDAQARQNPQVLGPENGAGLKNGVSRPNVVSLQDDILLGRDGAAHLDGLFIHGAAVFDHHHGIGPFRDHTARPDADGLARLDGRCGRLTHGHLSSQLQQSGEAVGCAERIAGADGVPVHGGPGEVRQVFGGDDLMAKECGRGPLARGRLPGRWLPQSRSISPGLLQMS